MNRRKFISRAALLIPIATGISGESEEGGSNGTGQNGEDEVECPEGSSKNVLDDGEVICFSNGLPAESRETESESKKDIERAPPPGIVRRLRESEREPLLPYWR